MSKKNLAAMKVLGKQLGAARRQAGYTQRALAKLVRLEEETLASIEQGRRSLLPHLAATLDELLGTKGMLPAGVENLPEADHFPWNTEQFTLHEREAIAISWYEGFTVPDLLQSPEYARALFRGRVPAYDDKEVEAKTAERLGRQKILQRKSPPLLSFVVWEPVLHMGFGGEQVRRAQLRHLRELTELPRLVLQVLPMETPSHAGLAGPFIILETPDHQHLAYALSHGRNHWIAQPDAVSNKLHRYAMLRSQALSPHDSRGLLDGLLGDK